MDQAEIKAAYGGRLTLMCGLDTQQFLPNISAAQTKEAAARKTAALSAGGGYIRAVSHTIQPDVPLENIYALFSR
jgi:uroporphyrinogen decarboxylase